MEKAEPGTRLRTGGWCVFVCWRDCDEEEDVEKRVVPEKTLFEQKIHRGLSDPQRRGREFWARGVNIHGSSSPLDGTWANFFVHIREVQWDISYILQSPWHRTYTAKSQHYRILEFDILGRDNVIKVRYYLKDFDWCSLWFLYILWRPLFAYPRKVGPINIKHTHSS